MRTKYFFMFGSILFPHIVDIGIRMRYNEKKPLPSHNMRVYTSIKEVLSCYE